MRKLMTIMLAAMMALLPVSSLAEFADLTELHADKFLPEGSAPIVTDVSYQSDSVNMSISTRRVSNSDVYVVDIYVRSAECFQRAHAGGAYGKTTARVRDMAAENNAVVAMTGDSGHYFSYGWAISNGTVHRDTRNRQRDIAILYRNGELVTVENENLDNDAIRADVNAGEIWQLFLFGPALLDAEGRAKKDFSDSNVKEANPRSLIGYYEPGHYCFVQVDGRGVKSALEERKTSRGLTLKELALLMEELGCKSAYNLDGGQSSMLWYGGTIISTPFGGGRNVGDIVLIKDLPRPAGIVQ